MTSAEPAGRYDNHPMRPVFDLCQAPFTGAHSAEIAGVYDVGHVFLCDHEISTAEAFGQEKNYKLEVCLDLITSMAEVADP